MATSAGKSVRSMSSIAALLLVMAAMMASSANAIFSLTDNTNAVVTVIVYKRLISPIISTGTSVTANPGATVREQVAFPLLSVVQIQIQIGTKVYLLPLDQITKDAGPADLLTGLTVTYDGSPTGKILVVATVEDDKSTVTVPPIYINP